MPWSLQPPQLRVALAVLRVAVLFVAVLFGSNVFVVGKWWGRWERRWSVQKHKAALVRSWFVPIVHA